PMGDGGAEAEALAGAEAALDLLRRSFGEYAAYCGVSRRGEGPEGLRAGAGEAAASAQSARALGQPYTLTPFAALGLPRALLDWLSSDGAQATVEESLAALDDLGPERAATAVRTLQVFLDERGSFVRTAERLHLHRNAVAYRIARIVEQLGVDLDDPDVRLTLQLACRARTLRGSRAEPPLSA
ncbi:MAG TPA: helix-turn-helix domain-containing protein, partial [Solirubrobacteraceae bacterium]|nr:helix-turn-helix domain-containing protein [Solirubrobacteraceae bacterium]